jgi:transketolase
MMPKEERVEKHNPRTLDWEASQNHYNIPLAYTIMMERRETTEIRRHLLRMCHRAKVSHIGSCLSTVEILYSLLFNVMKRNGGEGCGDHLLLSKAHASAALYATLAVKGEISESDLGTYCLDGGALPGHTVRGCAPGVEISAGSLGHALSIGAGICYAMIDDHKEGRVFVLMGDGECNEGSVWEAALLSSRLGLCNLTVIVDSNDLQGFGRAGELRGMLDISTQWRAFGWDALDVDGHDVDALTHALAARSDRPRAVIAHTIKGKGISFMEGQLCWHYRSPNDEEIRVGMKELDGQ